MKFSGQGQILLATYGASVWYDVGCADELNVPLSVDRWEHQETCTGTRGLDATGVKKLKGDVSLKLTDFNEKTLALAINGAKVAGGTGTVTVETMAAGIVAGDYKLLAHQGAAALVITDSAGSPATLALNTNYTVDLRTGTVYFVLVTGFTQPFKAAYTYTDDPYVPMFTTAAPEVQLRYNYINTQDGNKKGVVDLFRVRFDPVGLPELINSELLILPLSGTLLLDSSKPSTGALGQYGRATLASA